jgi:hypothetical protein
MRWNAYANCLFRSVSHQLYKTESRHSLKRALAIQHLTRNTCMQQPLAQTLFQHEVAWISQTLFQHEVFVITPTLNAGSRCSRHGNTIIVFPIFCTNPQKIDGTWTLLSTELSIYKIHKVGILFCFLWALF